MKLRILSAIAITAFSFSAFAQKQVEVNLKLRDGSIVSGTSSISDISLVTDFGKLVIPTKNVSSIKVGIPSDKGVYDKAKSYLSQLGNSSDELKKGAYEELVKLGIKAIPAVSDFINDPKNTIEYSGEYTPDNALNELKSNGNDKTQPLLLTISSIKKGEGKSFCGKLLAGKLQGEFDEILYLSPDELSGNNPPGITFQRYSGYDKMGEINTAKDWIASIVPSYSKYKVIIIELVELSKFNIPDKVLNGISLNLFILSSERVWSESDSRALGGFTKMTTTKPMVILKNTDSDRMETIVGEIPKRRSNVRKVAKRIVTFDFQRT